MPREIRTLKRAFFTDDKLTSVPRAVRLTFLGLIANADDYGRLRADPRLLKASIYPLDDDITSATVAEEIEQLAAIGRVTRYEVGGTHYLEIEHFEKHQVMNRKYGSDVPAPPTQDERTADALRAHGSKGEERSGEGAEKERSGVVGPVAPEPVIQVQDMPGLTGPQLSDQAELPASLFKTLPREAVALLDQFYDYPSATFTERKRYKDVAMQMINALDPKHPGVKIAGGQRVKARSPEHLADVCRVVAKDPPMDRNLVIVWVLKKLLDPPKGPSVTEVVQRNESATRQLEEQYDREAKAAGIQWATDNPEDYVPIRASVDANYAGKVGAFVERARTAELTQRCAKAARFPSYEKWAQNKRVPVPA